MKKTILISIALLVALIPSHAGKIVTDSLYSSTLKSFVKYNVYLPKDYEKENAVYPVIYLLHGLEGDYSDWAVKGNMATVADELIESGEVRPCVIIMPNAGDVDIFNVQNGYFNVPDWNYEDFFFNEFMPAAERKYRCISDKSHRAIMGLSMGGGGSTVYAMMHPELFSSCYAMSAWLDTDVNENMRKGKFYNTLKSVNEHAPARYIPNAGEDTIKELKTVKWFFDCGDDDGLLHLSVELHDIMTKAGIKNELRVRDGIHNWEYWHTALRLSLPFASRNFSR
ncbi:MAG: esterase family protein [Bacteroidales bacterium]|nr:esterase family protein [Bacteroidales bacterium]